MRLFTQTIEKYGGSVFTLRRGFEALQADSTGAPTATGDEIDLDALSRPY